MGRQCPKCGYERNADDMAPVSECPSCGVIYEKYEAMLRQREAQRLSEVDASAQRDAQPAKRPARQAEPFNWNVLPLVFAGIAGLVLLANLDAVRSAAKRMLDSATSINSSATSDAQLTVLALTCETTSTGVTATGQVQNRSQKAMTLEVNLTLYDRYDGIGSTFHHRAKLDQAPLAPLQVSTFTGTFPVRPPYADRCRVSGFVDSDNRDVSFNYAPGLNFESDEHAR